ncbi:MAG: 4-hydroxythreonine-4-phosphate dehydrogenase PdxA [Tissierellales bacterium]|nr:4-hydroxythreonine-4-phosphate dehydrogenase PdxA [Tissierellales bacterium]
MVYSGDFIENTVDHGVAFGKAGEGRANEESMIQAIKIAIDLSKSLG